MSDRLLHHDLLYVGEHLTCNHYKANIGSGFFLMKFGKGEQIALNGQQYNHIIFILKGKCSITCNQFINRLFCENEMVLISPAAAFSAVAIEPLVLLDMAFINPISGCDRLRLKELKTLCEKNEYDFRPIPIRHPLNAFLDLLVYCLQNGMNCAHLHELKHREIFFYFRGFYTKEELAELFYPIIGTSFDFRTFVYANYRSVQSAEKLIQLSNMSRSSFLRHFKEEFGMPLRQWMLQQTLQQIIGEISKPETTIKDLMARFGFDTHSNFTRFCKTYFKSTPTELLKKYRTNIPFTDDNLSKTAQSDWMLLKKL